MAEIKLTVITPWRKDSLQADEGETVRSLIRKVMILSDQKIASTDAITVALQTNGPGLDHDLTLTEAGVADGAALYFSFASRPVYEGAGNGNDSGETFGMEGDPEKPGRGPHRRRLGLLLLVIAFVVVAAGIGRHILTHTHFLQMDAKGRLHLCEGRPGLELLGWPKEIPIHFLLYNNRLNSYEALVTEDMLQPAAAAIFRAEPGYKSFMGGLSEITPDVTATIRNMLRSSFKTGRYSVRTLNDSEFNAVRDKLTNIVNPYLNVYRIVRFFPKDAFLFLSVKDSTLDALPTDRKHLRKAFNRVPMRSILEDPFKSAAALAKSEPSGGESGKTMYDLISELAVGEFALSWNDVSHEGDKLTSLELVAAIEFLNDEATLRDLWQRRFIIGLVYRIIREAAVGEQISEKVPFESLEETVVEGAPVYYFRLGEDAESPVFRIGLIDNFLLCSIDINRNGLEAAVQRRLRGEKTIASSESLKSNLEHICERPGLAELHVDLTKISPKGLPKSLKDSLAASDLLGKLNALTSITYAVAGKNDRLYDRLFVGLNRAHPAFPHLAAIPGLNLTALSVAPDNAFLVAATGFDAPVAASCAGEILRFFNPAILKKIQDLAASLEKNLKIDLKRDLPDGFGNNVLLALAPTGEENRTGALLSLARKPKDEATGPSPLAILEKGLAALGARKTADGTEITWFDIPLVAKGSLTPAFASADDRLLIASHLSLLEQSLLAGKNSGMGLFDRYKLKKALRIPDGVLCALVYIDYEYFDSLVRDLTESGAPVESEESAGPSEKLLITLFSAPDGVILKIDPVVANQR